MINNLISLQKLASSNSLQHRKNNKYGENLYLGTGMGPQTHELAVQAWYDEIKNYNFKKPGFSSNTGHFTQVVWKTSKELGVGIVKRLIESLVYLIIRLFNYMLISFCFINSFIEAIVLGLFAIMILPVI